MFILYLNLAAGAVASTVYGIWSLKWFHRGAALVGILNLVASMACFGFAVGYFLMIRDAGMNGEIVRFGFRHLAPLVLLAPALARFAELRRDERREALATQYEKELRG